MARYAKHNETKLTSEEMSRLRRNGLCLVCRGRGSVGHGADTRTYGTCFCCRGTGKEPELSNAMKDEIAQIRDGKE